jgi:hypothetical protein
MFEDGGKPVILSIDVLEEETPQYSAIVTKYPIEQGADITDHSQPENTKLSITGRFVDFPGGGTGPSLGHSAYASGYDSRAIIVFRRLDTVRLNGQLIKYRSERLDLSDCLISSLTYTQDKDSGNGIKFKLSIEQQAFAESKRVKTKRPATAAGQVCKAIGDKTGKEVGTDKQKVDSSMATKFVNAAASNADAIGNFLSNLGSYTAGTG